MNELIKERNELAKQLYVRNDDVTAEQAVRYSDDLMAIMYGSRWESVSRLWRESNQDQMTGEAPAPVVTGTNCPATFSIVDFKGAKWVRVQALGEDFVVAPEDLDDGADHFSYDSAQEKLKELGLATFNRMQGFLIAIYIEEINKALEEAGGRKFAKDIYISSELWHPVGSCADSVGDSSWYFFGPDGCFSNVSRFIGCFRCRPVLAYTA